jgi:hypothetical protein
MAAPFYVLEKLPNEPIIISTMGPEYLVSRHMVLSDGEIAGILEASAESLFVIADISKVPFSYNDIVMGSAQGARGKAPLWHHPKIRKMIFISRLNLVKLAAKTLATKYFGNLNVKVFDTLEEALVYCRSQEPIKA